MGWIYLAESEASQLPCLSGSNPSPTVRQTDIVRQSYYQECQTDDCQLRQYGTTLKPCEEICFQRWTLYTEDSPARMLVLLELEQGWMESEPAYSVKQCDLFQNVDLSSYSSKMSQESESMCLPSGKSLRRLATIAGMDSLVQRKSGQTTGEIDGGYLPTPVARDDGKTPEAHLAMKARMKGGPRKKITSLNVWVKMWPTPKATDFKGAHSPGKNGSKGQYLCGAVGTKAGGQLSPMWVEWLMGYPAGWTELEDWATQWYRPKRGKLLKG